MYSWTTVQRWAGEVPQVRKLVLLILPLIFGTDQRVQCNLHNTTIFQIHSLLQCNLGVVNGLSLQPRFGEVLRPFLKRDLGSDMVM